MAPSQRYREESDAMRRRAQCALTPAERWSYAELSQAWAELAREAAAHEARLAASTLQREP